MSIGKHIEPAAWQGNWANDWRLERRRRGLSCKQVAQLIGRSVELVRMYEQGEAMPTLVTAMKLAILYRTQVAAAYYKVYRELTIQMREVEERLVTRRRGTGP